ncbi:cation transporter, partial [Jatrophihabitans endophyticus]|uniref:cation transporter n=1 Tax=Jatrophihabitans endophyticus TaxID=1206085 RepID=UPI0019EF6998|nr:cation transporter [Jatrophihabitans endophyticus]
MTDRNPGDSVDAADRAIAPVGSSEASSGESNVTVLLALAANIGVGLLKLAAGLISGSASLLSEAAHSAGDST